MSEIWEAYFKGGGGGGAYQNFQYLQIILSGSSSSRALTLETNNGGRIWNISAMTGWLATKFLSAPVPVKDVVNFDRCVCQAVITQVNSVGSNHTIRVHMSCRSEVDGGSGQFCCQKCGVTHLNEMLNKPGQQVRIQGPTCSTYRKIPKVMESSSRANHSLGS